jgi:hypothetical protein
MICRLSNDDFSEQYQPFIFVTETSFEVGIEFLNVIRKSFGLQSIDC